MTYVSWAVFFEGASDHAYFNSLIPRVMQDIVLRLGTRNSTIPEAPAADFRRRAYQEVAEKACAERDSFHILFVHSDTGGRALAAQLEERSDRFCQIMNDHCRWPTRRCVTITPRHETEAWVLADPEAVTGALGYVRDPGELACRATPLRPSVWGTPRRC